MSDDRGKSPKDRGRGHRKDSSSSEETRPLEDDEHRAFEDRTSITSRERIEPNSTQAGALAKKVSDLEAGDPTVEMQMSEEMLAEWKKAERAEDSLPAPEAPTRDGATTPIDQERTAKRAVSDAIEVDEEGFVVFLARVTPRGDVRLPARLQQICADKESPLVLLKARVLGDEE
ncbi:MAG: hypothetical protein ACOCV2_08680 [Persicimonas sp.]